VSTPQSENVTLETMIKHLDHICQLAGNANHVGIGSDLDGGYGKEQCPADLDTIADLQKIVPLLQKRGYGDDDINRIMSQNFIDFLFCAWS
jgi:membrane dipeptidase